MADSSQNPAEQKTEVNPEAKEHWRKGNQLFEESKFAESISEYNEALKIKDDYADAYFNRALAERVNHSYNEAKKDLERVMELQPNSPDAPLLMGDIAESNNDFIGARYWYEKALSVDPNYSEAKNRLEHIDALIHFTEEPAGKGGQVAAQKMNETVETAVIEEGQIKKLPFYKSNIKFDSVIGLKKAKQYLKDNIVLAMLRPDLFKKYGKKMGVGLLLYGPPGTGKTHMVNAVAGEAGANVIIAQINQIVDMYTGNTEKNLHAVFDQARKNTPCIVAFDEVDAMGVKRSSGGEGGESSAMRLAVNAFLSEMNGIEKNPEGIYVIGTTNQPWDIDPALKRSGRFGDTLYIGPPNYHDRKELFKFYVRNKPHGRLSYGRLARATTGFSPADIEHLVERAVMRPLLHEYETSKGRQLIDKDILAVFKDKDFGGSSLDEWYTMVKKDVISKTETQIVDGKKQEVVKEGKLEAQEKVLYKAMIKDIKKNTTGWRITIKKLTRWWALHIA
ncbi:MAG: AAA family ATPase [Candidatus Marsarchaeota archaeon]|jgi:SpoVK/Ycf46/Vps4 family AAA+-type ATPase|nr:AAA family ATPase [Candidatus Marsarchaeota archaeon]MCL5419160.1 AAA family ATPase [Candidatus Marsarchaeota archaeon]